MYYNVEEMGGYYRIGSPEGVFCYVAAGQEKIAWNVQDIV